MSGGVDSSVAAALLASQGEAAFGVMMRLWSAGSDRANRCCSPGDMANARQVAAQLGIPFYVMDVRERFKRQVVDFFIDGYAQGMTPNPCMACNRHIRWDALFRYVLALGATHLATGHYARLIHSGPNERLLRAVDPRKDQSYVLSVMTQEHLRQARFPLGDLTKDQTRSLAASYQLPIAERPDSQDLCFAGDDYRSFLSDQGVQASSGPILDPNGNTLGQHQGLSSYTIGQRKGIGLAGPHPYYVLDKDMAQNALIVGARQDLGRSFMQVAAFNWVQGAPPASDFKAEVQIRYQARPAAARIHVLANPQQLEIVLDEPRPDVTPGQAAVLYQDQECLGGGTIQS
jgi:tRNA-specific 2-thiouridylase